MARVSEMDVSTTKSNHMLEEKYMKSLFDVIVAGIERTRTVSSAIFLTISDHILFQETVGSKAEEELTFTLQTKIRKSDLLFKLEDPYKWFILLFDSGEGEAKAFLQRLFSDLKKVYDVPLSKESTLFFPATVAEIGNSDVEFQEVIEHSKQSLTDGEYLAPWHIEYVDAFKKKKTEKIKVSILEDNDILRNILQTLIEKLDLKGFQLEIQTFHDGYSFLQSNSFLASHRHIVILNDILPRKNGMEVLHTIRKLPNNKKFTIFMMTKGKSEEDMIYAYENGVDLYLIKPFNLRLFEAQFKRIFERSWS